MPSVAFSNGPRGVTDRSLDSNQNGESSQPTRGNDTTAKLRRIYDTRTVLSLRAFGVTEFATSNVRDFQGCGFTKVWDPISS